MARKLLREIAMNDGRDENGAKAFASCCINILQSGCRYNKGVEKHIKRLLKDRTEKVCGDILSTLERPHRPFFVPRHKGSPPKRKRRWKERDSNPHDRRQPYYVDKRPHEYNRHRPRNENRGKRNRQYFKPNSNQMGRMESKRRRTHARHREIQSEPKRETNGT